MKSKFKLLPVFGLCALPVTSAAQNNSGSVENNTSPASEVIEGCNNPDSTPDGPCEDEVTEEDSAAEGTISGGSVIVNTAYEFTTKAHDYVSPSASASCGSCSGGEASTSLPALTVTRLLRPRYNEFAPKELWGSFGNGQYWSEIDRALFIHANGTIAVRDVRQSDKQIDAIFDPARAAWAELDDESFASITLLTATGGIITDNALRHSASNAVLLNHDGSKDIYQIFRRRDTESAIGENGTRAFGRLIATVDRNCLLYTSPSPRDRTRSRMPSSA